MARSTGFSRNLPPEGGTTNLQFSFDTRDCHSSIAKRKPPITHGDRGFWLSQSKQSASTALFGCYRCRAISIAAFACRACTCIAAFATSRFGDFGYCGATCTHGLAASAIVAARSFRATARQHITATTVARAVCANATAAFTLTIAAYAVAIGTAATSRLVSLINRSVVDGVHSTDANDQCKCSRKNIPGTHRFPFLTSICNRNSNGQAGRLNSARHTTVFERVQYGIAMGFRGTHRGFWQYDSMGSPAEPVEDC